MNTTKKMSMAFVALVAAFATFATFAEEKSATAAKPAEVKATNSGKQYKPLAEARAQIGAIVAEPTKMTEVIKDLSPEDQKTFIADVNAAIEKLPGSTEDKTAKYLNVNRAALKGVSNDKMGDILAVTFATVPPESLTVISEQYANDLFNRDADRKVTDAAFEKVATEIVGKVEKATVGSDDAGVRNTLAILMFVKADNGKIEGFGDKLVETIPDAATRKIAKEEWIPAATSGDKPSYDSMLAYADAGKAPNLDIVLTLAGPQILDAVTTDIISGMNSTEGYQTTPVLDQAFGGFDDASAYIRSTSGDTTSAAEAQKGGGETPKTANPKAPWNPEYNREEVKDKTVPVVPEPEPYPFNIN